MKGVEVLEKKKREKEFKKEKRKTVKNRDNRITEIQSTS